MTLISLLEYAETHQFLLWCLTTLSVITFIGTLIVIPWLIVRIPADYFAAPRRRTAETAIHPSALRITMIIAKNILGVLLVMAGILMLMLPGQGLLTIILGLVLMNFPGKYRLEQWLIRRKPVLPLLNRLRRRARRRPLVLSTPGATAANETPSRRKKA